MEIVDLSIDDPEIEIKNVKKVRKKFKELKKYVPFLKYLFELDPETNSKYKTLIDWLQIRNHSTLDHWHVISCERTIRRRYEKLKNKLDFPTHIIEIFEGGIAIVISDEDDLAPLSNSTILKKEAHSTTNDNEQNNKNAISKEPSSTTSIKIVQRLEGIEESRKNCENLSTRGKTEASLSAKSKNKFETNSSSKISSKSRSSNYCKDSSIEKKDNNTDRVDASVFDIVSWNDLEKENEKSPVPENLSHKTAPSRPRLTELDKRKNKKYTHSQEKTETNSIEIEHQSYESLIKQKKEIIKLLRDDDKKSRPSNSRDNCNLEKPQEIELFQRRESTRSERKKSFVDPSIINSVKYVLTKNPEIIADVVNDSMGTKIVYDYKNVTKASTSKTTAVKNIVINKIPQLRKEIGETRDTGCVITENVSDIISKTPETNYNCTAGNAYRKAMHEEQTSLQFQESVKEFTHHANSHSKQDIQVHSPKSNKKSQQLIHSTQSRVSNSKSSSRTHVDRRLTSVQSHNKQLKSQGNDCDKNIKYLNSSDARDKSTKRKTSCTKTFDIISNSSESKQKQKEDNEVVLMSFVGSRKVIHRIESESSLEDFVPEKINFVSRVQSSSIEKVKSNDLAIKSKTDETSKQSCSSSNYLKNTLKNSKDCDSKLSKTKTNSVSDSKEIKMPILFKKDEPRKSCEPKIMKPKHASVSKKLNGVEVSSKIDHKTTKPKNDSGKDSTVDVTFKEKKSKSESKNIFDKTQKRKNSVNQEQDCSLKQKLLKIGNVSKKSDGKIINDGSHIDLEKSSEKQEVKNENNCNKADKTIKIKDYSCTNHKNSKRKKSKESTEKIKKHLEEKTEKSTKPNKDLILTPKKPTNSPAGGSILKLNSGCSDIIKGEDSKQRHTKTKDSSNKNNPNIIKLKDNNSHTVLKCLKRTSTESITEINNQPVKKSKISTKPIKVPTPKKHTDTSARRFYRELNNLTCTFKESLLPQTIGRRRCSSSWLNLSEDVNQQSKNINADLIPAPIQRRRQTCSGMPNLKLTLQRSSDNDEYYIKDIGNERFSDDIDEFDIDEHRERNKEISYYDITEGAVECNTNNSFISKESPCKKMPRLIAFDSIPIQTVSNSLGNNDSKMIFKSTKTCVLCNKNSNDLTNHYVVKHKTESYVSRLSSADIRRLEKEINVAIPVCRNRYRINCVFCKQMIEDHFENFYAHFSYHTGEYNFQCEGCKITKPYKEDIGSHQLRSRLCRNTKIVKVHNYELEKTVIYLFICKICNFVNLNELNLQNHIRKQHDLMSNELENSKKCFLLVKDIREIVKDVHHPGFDADNCETDAKPTEEETPLCAEQDFICELPMDIQNILMDGNNLSNGQEHQNKNNISKTIYITNQPDFDEPITALSPEALLEEMHASNNTKNTQARNMLSESKDLHCENNLTTSLPDIYTSDKISSRNNKRLFDDLKAAETHANIISVSQSSKKVKLNQELNVKKQNDSESLTSIEAYIRSTNKIVSPKRHNIHDAENSKSVLNRPRENHKSIVERNAEKIPNEKSNQSNENSYEDCESLTSIKEYIESTNEIICTSSEKQKTVIDSPVEINLEKLSPSKRSKEDSSHCIDKHFEDFHDSISLTNIEAFNKSTNEIFCPNSESRIRIQEFHDAKNSMVINKNLSEKLNKSPERELEKLYASKTLNEESSQRIEEVVSEHSLVERTTHSELPNKILAQSSVEPEIRPLSPEYSHSMIYRQYDKLNIKNFGLFKCLIEDCLYSTNSDGEFKVHCSNHNQTNILDCPYCSTKSSCLENVIHHIWKEHSMSNYQCVKCSYRSIVPGNVIIHRRICHKDTKTDESMYKCGYLKISKESQRMPRKIRDNITSLKCPDCEYRFFSSTSIKSHLQKTHPLTFKRFISLKLNELACIQCTKESNCKETMQIHLALQHPDEPGFVIERKLKPKDFEDPVEGLMVVDISIDVLETDIKILKESGCLKTVNSNEDQETLITLEAEPKQLKTVSNCKTSSISAVMPLESPTKAFRFPDNCTLNHHPGQSSEAILTNKSPRSPLIEKINSSMKVNNMEETPQIEEDCCPELSGSIVHSAPCEPQQNEQSKALEDIEKMKNLHIHPISKQVHDNLQIQSPNESVQTMFIDINHQAHLKNKRLEVHFEITSNFKEAVAKEGERIKLLLDLLVENTGIHSSSLYGCPHCNSSFMHFELWLTHMKNKHTSIGDTHCPYCIKQLQLDSAESHFKEHLRHEYICYYCLASCCSREKIQEHFSLCHENCKTIELPIASFYLVIKQDAIVSDYTALLEHFSEEIYLHLVKKIQQNTIKEWTAGLTDSCLEEMEISQYKPEAEGQPLFKCFEKLCPFVASDEKTFDDHLVQHELPKTFECTYCRFLSTYPSWESIKCHRLQHLSPSLYVCCVCKFVHYDNDGIIKHIEKLHNSRDVPVLYLLRGGLNFKVSLSIFLSVNKISFTTSKSCFCCAQEISSSNNFLNHLKKVHKITLCPRCQLCDKIILTHLDGEAHCKEYHKMESFRIKYDVLTTYLNNLILTSRSPLTMEIRLRNKKCSDQQMESNRNKSSPVEVKEEISVKGELEEDKQTQSISIKCLHTNQLFENRSEKDDNTFQQHLHANATDPNSNQQLQTILVNRDIQHSTGGMIIENTLVPSYPQNSVPSTQHHQVVNTGKTNSSQDVQPSSTVCHSIPLTNTVIQCSSQEQTIAKEVPLQSLTAVPHSEPTTVPRCSLPSTSCLRSLLFSKSQKEVTTEKASTNSTLSMRERDSLPSRQKQHVVLKNIQLATGNAILSIPLEASTAEHQPGIEEELQRIPVITTRIDEPNIQQTALHPTLSNTGVQVNKLNLDEIAPICGTCNFACIDFIHLQTHYETIHAIYNEGFYFYVDRKIGCMYCHFQGVLSSFAQHHATFHSDRKKLCHSVIDPIRCGICNDIFYYPPSSSANSFALSPLCACPGHQRTLADCLSLPVLKTLQDIGYQYYKYSCDACGLLFQSSQQFVYHYISVHHQFIDPQIWRTRLKYYCCICPSMVSYNILDVIYHMRFSHLLPLSLPLYQKLEFYKRIRIAHPNGYLVSLGDLRNTGQFDEENFKQKIYNFEAQYII